MKGLVCFDFHLVLEKIMKPDQTRKMDCVLLPKLYEQKNNKKNLEKQSGTNLL